MVIFDGMGICHWCSVPTLVPFIVIPGGLPLPGDPE